METAYPKRKAGRPKTGRKVEKVTIMLPPDLREWGIQHHPDGLSALLRNLLEKERAKSQRAKRREP